MTDAWCIDTGTDKLVLRCLPAHLPPFKVRLSVAAQDRAAHAGLAPKLLRTEGGFLVAEHNTKLYTLSRFANDTQTLTAPTDVPTARHLGTALGHLHRTLATMAAVKVSDRWQLPDHGPLHEALAAHSRPGCNHPDAARALETKLSWAAELQATARKQLNSLRQQVIHGDIHPGNILAHRGQVALFIDFDQARSSPRIYEVLRALIYCTQPAGPPSTYTARVTAFLHGYQAVAPLTPDEANAMVPLFQAVQILDPFGLHTCQTADKALMRFGHARFALIYWLRCNEHHLTNLAARTSAASGQTKEAPGGTGP